MTTITTIKMGELDALHIQSTKFHAKIILQGGHLVEFSTTDKPQNWLWLGEKVSFKQGVAIRGGVPICFPLFGNLTDNAQAVQSTFSRGMAKHGVARIALWSLDGQVLSDDKAIITLNWLIPQKFREQYPTLELSARLTFAFSQKGFEISLDSQNLGKGEISFSQAFHTYLPTTDIKMTTIQGFDKSSYIDMLQDKNQPMIQVGDIHFEQEVDRIYHTSPKILLKTPSYQATLISKNSLSTIIWNPWIDKSQTLDQFLPQDFEKMVCIETANAGKDFVTLKPKHQHTLTLNVSKV